MRLEPVEVLKLVVGVIIIFAELLTPPPQSDPAKQINILFVYAENNNYFMVGCSVAAVGCMINLSSPTLK